MDPCPSGRSFDVSEHPIVEHDQSSRQNRVDGHCEWSAQHCRNAGGHTACEYTIPTREKNRREREHYYKDIYIYVDKSLVTHRSDIPEWDSFVSRASSQSVGVRQKLHTIDWVHVSSQCHHTHTTEGKVFTILPHALLVTWSVETYLLVSHTLTVWSIEADNNTTPSQCQLQHHTV